MPKNLYGFGEAKTKPVSSRPIKAASRPKVDKASLSDIFPFIDGFIREDRQDATRRTRPKKRT